MSATAYCSNCRSNFTNPDDVANILRTAPHYCRGCEAVRGDAGPHENASPFQPAMKPVDTNEVPAEALVQRTQSISEIPVEMTEKARLDAPNPPQSDIGDSLKSENPFTAKAENKSDLDFNKNVPT